MVGVFTNAQQLAFPSAYGAGAYVTGGRGQTVYHVTTLDFNDSVGSFKWAYEEAVENGGGTIVFDISGVIVITGDWSLQRPNFSSAEMIDSNISILGQTAPFPGITIDNEFSSIRTFGLGNQIIRYLKFRGKGTEGFYFQRFAGDGILDHCSFAWGKSGSTNTSMSSVSSSNYDWFEDIDITMSYNLLAHSGRASNTGNSTGDANGKFGDVSIFRNVYHELSYRTPLKTGGNGQRDIINNIISKHRDGKRVMRFDAQPVKINHIGNIYTPSVSNTMEGAINDGNKIWTNNTNIDLQLYNEGNYFGFTHVPDSGLSGDDEKDFWDAFRPNGSEGNPDMPDEWFVDKQHPLAGRDFTIYLSDSLNAKILPEVGACRYINDSGVSVYYRDAIDTRYVDDVLNQNNRDRDGEIDRTGQPIDYTSNTRPANFYQSNAHIPEAYFIANGITGTATIHNEIQPSGYTMLEEYVNQVDEPEEEILATSVSITPATATVNIPNKVNLTTEFTPINTTNQSGVWVSSNESVATVNTIGEVTPVSEGNATITFVSNDGNFTDTSSITVTDNQIALTSVEVTPANQTIELGDNLQLTVNLTPSNTTDTQGNWTSSNNNVAYINNSFNGLVVANDVGTATITYTSNGGVTGSTDVTVVDTFYGTYELFNADTDTKIQDITGDAIIDLQGVTTNINIRGIPPGGDGNSDVESVETVRSGADSGRWVESNPLYALLPSGNSGNDYQPYTVSEGAYTFTVNYYSANGSSGTLVASDEFTLTFTFDGTSIIPVTSVVVSPATITTNNTNGVYQLTADVLPQGATDTTGVWSTTNSAVATVSQTGLVTLAGGQGQATITFASNYDGNITDTTVITVDANLAVSLSTVNSKKRVSTNN